LNQFSALQIPSVLQAFNDLINPYLLRRKKEDVDDTIPQKEETLVEVDLTSIQKTYYKAIMERNMQILSQGKVTNIFHNNFV
jgi:SNF2 family DNA or RNA helicase